MATTAPTIELRARRLAIGFALRGKKGELKFTKSFQQREDNYEQVRDFLSILKEASLYKGGNEIFEIPKEQAEYLLPAFSEHSGTSGFLKSIGKHGGIIVIMHRRMIPSCYEEAAMLAALFKPPAEKPDKKKKDKKKK